MSKPRIMTNNGLVHFNPSTLNAAEFKFPEDSLCLQCSPVKTPWLLKVTIQVPVIDLGCRWTIWNSSPNDYSTNVVGADFNGIFWPKYIPSGLPSYPYTACSWTYFGSYTDGRGLQQLFYSPSPNQGTCSEDEKRAVSNRGMVQYLRITRFFNTGNNHKYCIIEGQMRFPRLAEGIYNQSFYWSERKMNLTSLPELPDAPEPEYYEPVQGTCVSTDGFIPCGLLDTDISSHDIVDFGQIKVEEFSWMD